MRNDAGAIDTDLGDFDSSLREACGHFVLLNAPERRKTEGKVFRADRAGIRFVEICSNLQQLSRSRKEIRLDLESCFFLIIQEEGNALMSQHEASHWLQPGDMVVIDSAEPSEFTFFGEFNRQNFMLLSRADVLSRVPPGSVAGGNFLPRQDPVNKAIAAVLQKIRLFIVNEALGKLLSDALFGLVGVMVSEEPRGDFIYKAHNDTGTDRALKISRQYIDTRYRDPKLRIREMARILRLSMKQVQRGFSALSTTPTKYLLIKRLEHARKEIDHVIAGRRTGLISTIAFESGFSDLSYFQRTFRRAFGNTPRDYLSGIAEMESRILPVVDRSEPTSVHGLDGRST